ncbi:MAG TPA: hypothetical protein VKT50_12220 [Candidatus Acidoferrales bacterium]|nr:hypothetical protein [Candidatus Acidoferrales bacterium]
MRDWRSEASGMLANSKLAPAERDEVSRELAGYLEDLCSDAPAHGLDESPTTQRAAAELYEDKHLGAHLYRARREGTMNDRTKQLWLPGMSMLFASAALLAAFQVLALGLYHALALTPMVGSLSLHARTYPELVRNVMRHNSAALMIYFGWLCTLPFLGALGAYWSRRVGSSRSVQITTALFPLVLFLAIFVGQQDVGQRGTSLSFLAMDALPPAHVFFMFLSVSANLLLNWVLIPGAALLSGVLPFLIGTRSHRREIAMET